MISEFGSLSANAFRMCVFGGRFTLDIKARYSYEYFVLARLRGGPDVNFSPYMSFVTIGFKAREDCS